MSYHQVEFDAFLRGNPAEKTALGNVGFQRHGILHEIVGFDKGAVAHFFDEPGYSRGINLVFFVGTRQVALNYVVYVFCLVISSWKVCWARMTWIYIAVSVSSYRGTPKSSS